MDKQKYSLDSVSQMELMSKFSVAFKEKFGMEMEFYMNLNEDGNSELYIDNVSFDKNEMEKLVELGVYNNKILKNEDNNEFYYVDSLEYLIGPAELFELILGYIYGLGTKVAGTQKNHETIKINVAVPEESKSV